VHAAVAIHYPLRRIVGHAGRAEVVIRVEDVGWADVVHAPGLPQSSQSRALELAGDESCSDLVGLPVQVRKPPVEPHAAQSQTIALLRERDPAVPVWSLLEEQPHPGWILRADLGCAVDVGARVQYAELSLGLFGHSKRGHQGLVFVEAGSLHPAPQPPKIMNHQPGNRQVRMLHEASAKPVFLGSTGLRPSGAHVQ